MGNAHVVCVCITYNFTVHGAELTYTAEITAGYILFNCVCDE